MTSYIIAQLPNPTADNIGNFFLVAVFIILGVDRFKNLFFPAKPSDQTNVTKGELSELRATLNEYVKKVELQLFESRLQNLSSRQKSLARFTYKRYERLDKQLSNMRVEQERLRREMIETVNRAAERLATQIDEIDARNQRWLEQRGFKSKETA